VTAGTAAGPQERAARPRLRAELVAGGVLVGWTLLAALAVRADRSPNMLDRFGFAHLPVATHSAFWLRITDLGSFAALVVGSLLAALVVVGRDPRRALACLCAPSIAAAMVDWVVKPEVGRYYLDVLSFPSGSMTVVAAVATAWTLAVPARLRWAVAAVGVAAIALTGIAVVAVRWHYPSDALAGAAFGVGLVLLLDGLLHLGERSRTAGDADAPGATADDHLRAGAPPPATDRSDAPQQ
jgi:membrane-associated phospholipid phosphatase